MRKKGILGSVKGFVFLVVMLITTSSSYAEELKIVNGLRCSIDRDAKTTPLYCRNDVKFSGDIVVPNEIISKDGGKYPVVAFYETCLLECEKLNSIVIPSSVKSLGDFCLSGCYNLKRVIIPSSILEIGTSYFAYCANLPEVYILSPLKQISDSTDNINTVKTRGVIVLSNGGM